ncbi:MAG TPA: hypothetical protein VJ464_13355 [Blastocatellia bacterium]|nr:hypothetical protein [Blastocatellia bacterium]
MINPQDLWLRPGETTEQYNQRVTPLKASIDQAALDTNNKSIVKGAASAGVSIQDLPSLLPSDDPQKIKDELAKQYGYDSFDSFTRDVFTKPSKTTEQFYNDAYNAAGLPDLINQLTTKKNQLNTATGNINENPWLDEASRVGRAKRLQELANGDISNLQDEYNLRLNQVHDLVQQNSQDFANNQTLNEARLNYLLKQAEEKAQQQKATTLQKYLPDYFGQLQESQKPVTVELNEGNSLYAWNPQTKKFELQAQKPKTYKPTSGSTTTGTGTTTTKTVKLSASQQEDLVTMSTVEDLANTVIQLGQSVNWGGVGGNFTGSVSQFFAKNFGTGTKQEEQLRNYIGNIQATIAKLRGGTSFTPNEEKLLQSYTPTINDSPLVIQSKIASLKTFIASKRQNTLSVAGGNVQGSGATVAPTKADQDYVKSLGY